MPIIAQPEQDQIKARPVRLGIEKGPQAGLVLCSRLFGGQFAQDAVNVFFGDINLLDERQARHAVIAVGMLGRHAALIAPEQVNF